MQHSETFDLVAAALAAAQGAFPTIPRDRTVTVHVKAKNDRPASQYRYSYAPLETILGCVRQALSENHLALIQSPMLIEENGRMVEVMHTRLIHSSGQWFSANVPIFYSTGDNQSQAYASGLTYSRRYGVTMLLCVAADEDDDAGGQGAEYERKSPGQASAPRGNVPNMPVAKASTSIIPSGDELDEALRQFESAKPAADAALDETAVILDEATGEIVSPWGSDLTPGQASMGKQRALAANLTDAAVVKLCGIITQANVSESLQKLRDAANAN